MQDFLECPRSLDLAAGMDEDEPGRIEAQPAQPMAIKPSKAANPAGRSDQPDPVPVLQKDQPRDQKGEGASRVEDGPRRDFMEAVER